MIFLLTMHYFSDPLELLKSLEGDWQLTFLQVDQSGEYVEVGTSLSEIKVKLGGALVQEETIIKTATQELPLLVNYSWDRVRNVYRKCSTDGVTGLMDIQEGQMKEEILELSNVNRKTWFVGQSGKDVAFRIRFDLSDLNRPEMTADVSLDYGQNWLKFQKVIYSRIVKSSGH